MTLQPIDTSEFRKIKVIVLSELEPLSDEFSPIVLTENEIKHIRDYIIENRPDCKSCGNIQVPIRTGYSVMLEDVPEFDTDADLAQLLSKGECAKIPEEDDLETT